MEHEVKLVGPHDLRMVCRNCGYIILVSLDAWLTMGHIGLIYVEHYVKCCGRPDLYYRDGPQETYRYDRRINLAQVMAWRRQG